MTHFDPNAAADENSGVFGLPYTREESSIVMIPVPWEVTTSYGGGTCDGPAAILSASRQVDLFDSEVLKPYESGIHMLEENRDIRTWNDEGRKLVLADNEKDLPRINALGDRLNTWVCEQTAAIFASGKTPAIVGGDHSTPFGAFQAAGAAHGKFGILHFDAHSDTRCAYNGHTWSHASIMYNALARIPTIEQLVQVGIRDYCEEESNFVASQGERVSMFTDLAISRRSIKGDSWDRIARDLIAPLPKKVWVSFDIDGLDPRFCPHTGTPVPGGLDFNQAIYVLSLLARSGRTIIGFDLNEVAPAPRSNATEFTAADEWDANVGARLLYKLCAFALLSQGKRQINA